MAELTREEILRQLRERILAFATSRGIREAAEDLTQDVLMVLHEKYPHVSELRFRFCGLKCWIVIANHFGGGNITRNR
jgi:hypothetical protein